VILSERDPPQLTLSHEQSARFVGLDFVFITFALHKEPAAGAKGPMQRSATTNATSRARTNIQPRNNEVMDKATPVSRVSSRSAQQTATVGCPPVTSSQYLIRVPLEILARDHTAQQLPVLPRIRIILETQCRMDRLSRTVFSLLPKANLPDCLDFLVSVITIVPYCRYPRAYRSPRCII
jgi:hypothetical protein